jgi:hypothetical protein
MQAATVALALHFVLIDCVLGEFRPLPGLGSMNLDLNHFNKCVSTSNIRLLMFPQSLKSTFSQSLKSTSAPHDRFSRHDSDSQTTRESFRLPSTACIDSATISPKNAVVIFPPRSSTVARLRGGGSSGVPGSMSCYVPAAWYRRR